MSTTTSTITPHQGRVGRRLASAWRSLSRNPVTLKELRGRMRGRRAFVVLTLYLAVMSAIITLIYLAYSAAANDPYGPSSQDAGKVVFGAVVGVQVFLVLFVGPAFTAGAISGEKERQTYDLLRTTLLSAHAFVTGKLLSALSYVLLLVLASVPLQSLAFLLGGISFLEVILAQMVIVISAVAFALIGVYASSIMRSTLASTVLTYGIAIFLAIGLPILAFVSLIFTSNGPFSPSGWVSETLYSYFFLTLAAINLPAALVVSDAFLIEQGSFWGMTQTSYGHTIYLFSPWYLNTILYSLLAVILYWRTVRRVQRIAVS